MGSKFRFLRHPAKSLLICIRSLENKSKGSKATGRAVTMAVFKTSHNSQMSKKMRQKYNITYFQAKCDFQVLKIHILVV